MHFRNGQLSFSPSDVTEYLGCPHSAVLSLGVASGAAEPPTVSDDAELLFAKGREHEAAHLRRLRAEGLDVYEIELAPPGRTPTPDDWERAARETEEAMRADRDVIYQGVLGSGRWRGVADFLLGVDSPSPWLGLGNSPRPSPEAPTAQHGTPGNRPQAPTVLEPRPSAAGNLQGLRSRTPQPAAPLLQTVPRPPAR